MTQRCTVLSSWGVPTERAWLPRMSFGSSRCRGRRVSVTSQVWATSCLHTTERDHRDTGLVAGSLNLLALQEQACFALAVAARNVVGLYRPLLEPMGLTHPQYLVMLALWEHESLTVGELSGLLRLIPATLSPLLRRLESQGYLRRERQLADERVVHVSLTRPGRDLRQRALAVPGAIVERLGIEVADLQRLRAELDVVIERSQQAADLPA